MISLLSISVIVGLILIINISHSPSIKSTEHTPTNNQETEEVEPVPDNKDDHETKSKDAEPATQEPAPSTHSRNTTHSSKVKNDSAQNKESHVSATNEQYSTDIPLPQPTNNDNEQEERNKSISQVTNITNTYPDANNCPQNSGIAPSYGALICESTSYVSWKIKERYGKTANEFGISGDAKDWEQSASAMGLRVDNIPERHSVGYSSASNAASFGHVVWIESVNTDGTVNLSEYNNLLSSISGQAHDFGYRTNVPASSFRYIHFD